MNEADLRQRWELLEEIAWQQATLRGAGMSDRPTEVQRVDSSTPEGRLWNWLAREWERVTESNYRQSESLRKVRELAKSAEFMTPNHDCDAIGAVSVADLLAALDES